MTLNIILILLILHTIGYMVGPKKSTILSCGLFAYVGVRDRHNFSWDKFNHLGLDNDERGGDSVGRVVGDVVEKYVSKKAKTTYKEYVIANRNCPPSNIAIGHTRKASVGEVSVEKAQPVVLDLPSGEGKFIMVHNGTIHNWEDLAKKYGVDKTGKSDSMVIAEIIMNNGYDVLLEYVGAAAIIIKDDRYPDSIFVFKGMSKSFNKASEERPLYYYQEDENSMYISSREEGLYFIGGDVDTVFDFDCNQLYEIHEGRIVSKTEYDRSECAQNKAYTAGSYYGGNNNNSNGYREVYDAAWDEYDSGAVYERGIKGYLRNEKITTDVNQDKILCFRLRYYFSCGNNSWMYANGPVNLSESGVRSKFALKPMEKTYYFYRGIMLKDEAAYRECKREFGKARLFNDTDLNIQRIAKYSMHPVCTVDCQSVSWENIRNYDPTHTQEHNQSPYYTGTIWPLFATRSYEIKYGSLKKTIFKSFMNRAVHTSSNMKIALPPYNQNNKPDPIENLDGDDYEFPENSIVCPRCNGTGEDFVGNNYCATCGGNGYIIVKDEDPKSDKNSQSQDDEDTDVTNLLDKAIDDGLQALLLAIDGCRGTIEEIGVNSNKIKIALDNLASLEDALLEVKNFKTTKIIASYEQF